MMELIGKGRACIPEGLTNIIDVLDQFNKVWLKSKKKEENSMTGLRFSCIQLLKLYKFGLLTCSYIHNNIIRVCTHL